MCSDSDIAYLLVCDCLALYRVCANPVLHSGCSIPTAPFYKSDGTQQDAYNHCTASTMAQRDVTMACARDRRDVRTVFHEHGHALQFMLTEQTDYYVAGINGIPEDAVEEPSQFMEFWSAPSQGAWAAVSLPPCQPCSTCGGRGYLLTYNAHDCHMMGSTLFLATARMLIRACQRSGPMTSRRLTGSLGTTRPARRCQATCAPGSWPRATSGVRASACRAGRPRSRGRVQASSWAGAPDGSRSTAGQPGGRASAHADWLMLTAELDILCVPHGLSRCGCLLGTAGWDSTYMASNMACWVARAAKLPYEHLLD